MIQTETIPTNLCGICFRREAAPEGFVFGQQACKPCWDRVRAVIKRLNKMRPGVCSMVNTALPAVRRLRSLPGQLELFGESER